MANDDTTLHRLVFEGKTDELERCLHATEAGELRTLLACRDSQGNTALHLACILGCLKSIKLLTEHGASCRVNNNYKCSPLHEAVSFGNRENLHAILDSYIKESKVVFGRSTIEQCLTGLPDCCLRLEWKFRSWIPFVSSLLPGDICTIRKKGGKLRLDTSIPNLESYLKAVWRKKEDVSLLINTDLPIYGPYLVNHERRTYRDISDMNDAITMSELNAMLLTEIFAMRFETKNAHLTEEVKSLWSSEAKTERLSGYLCKGLKVTNVEAQVIIRTEHMNEEMMKQVKQFRTELSKKPIDSINFKDEIKRFEESMSGALSNDGRKDRIIPKVSFDDYQNAGDGGFAAIGREIKISIKRKPLEINALLTNEFPLKTEDFTRVLECVVTLRQFQRLKEITELVSPRGFPIRIEVPIVPTVKAIVTLLDFNLGHSTNESIFDIPSDYKLVTTNADNNELGLSS